MSGLVLYLRSRHVPAALGAAVGLVGLLWTLWSVFSEQREVEVLMVLVTIMLLVAVATATLEGPDDELDRTAALRWPLLRLLHAPIALGVVIGLLLVTITTSARFGPAGFVVRDAAGLLGLTALGAATLGVSRSWFVPLGWTMAAVLIPASDRPWQQALLWQIQMPGNRPAALVAGLLAVGGCVAWAISRRTGQRAGAPSA